MKITSSVFQHNQNILSKFTCDGENVSPPLAFFDVPVSAKSLVLIVDDPDATIGTFTHWVVYNINPQAMEVLENSIPEGGIETKTDFGTSGYGGPCPMSGKHRYFFKLYALDTLLALSKNANKKMVEDAMKNHIIETAELIGLYSRSK